MPSINVDLHYFDHPKTRRLVGLLGRGAEVLPIKLWAYCGAFHAIDGKLTGHSIQEIESVLGWWGQEGALVEALLRVSLLDILPDGTYQVHDWENWEGHLAVYHERAKTAAKAKWARVKDASSIPSSNASSIDQAMPVHCSPMQCSPMQKDKDLSAAPAAPKVSKPKHEEQTTPFWKETVDFIDTTWTKKKGVRFYWKGQLFKKLKALMALYQPWGVMSLWETYLNLNDVYAKNAGYSFEMFESKIPTLVDDPAWRTASRRFEDKLLGKMPDDIAAVLNEVVPGGSLIKRAS